MKQLLLVLISFLALPGFSQNWSNVSFVHSSGRMLKDGAGETIRLNGVNLGGWLLWEGWIWGGGLKSEHQIDKQVGALYGQDSIAVFKAKVRQNYIQEADIRQIASRGMNVVRVPFNHTLLESDEQPFVYKEAGFRVLDSLLLWCERHDVYAVLDLHAAPGGQNVFFIADPDKVSLWKSELNQERTVALWHAIAKRYADRGIIAGYDLLNEPKVNAPADLLKLYERIIDTIRTVDSHHLLIVEGNNLAQQFDVFKTAPDPNMAFSFHYYTWFNERDKLRTLTPYPTVGERLNVPMWCGEWGEDSNENLTEIRQLLDNPAYGFCGSAFWTWKKVYKDNNKMPLSEILLPADAQVVIKWLTGMGKRPTPEEARAGWIAFLTAIQSSQCRVSE